MKPVGRRQSVAVAHPNIALVKYWGKQAAPGNLPATPSLSFTLDSLTTTTRVVTARRDSFRLDGVAGADAKVDRFLAELRQSFDIPPLDIATENNFPTGAGLASSASGFAALITAIDALLDLGLDAGTRSSWARRGSASAARSIFGGFVTLEERGGDWTAAPLAGTGDMPLAVAVAVVSAGRKSVPSSKGMERSRTSSPFYDAWRTSTAADFDDAVAAVHSRDFPRLAEVAEHSCLKLHALMLSTRPALVYWDAATLAAVHLLRRLRDRGLAVFFTVDAGPQVKAFCRPEDAAEVARALAGVPGVQAVLRAGAGPGARVADGD